MVIDDRSEHFEDLMLSDLSAYLSAYLRLRDLNLSSRRHFLREFWLTTNDPKIDLKLSKPDPRPHLTGFPPPEPKEKNVFL
jgi:hypothetical protein